MHMKSDIFEYGKWICPERLAGLTPVDVFDRPESVMGEEPKNVRFYVRKRFNVSKAGIRAHIRVSADDYYKLYITGSFVAKTKSAQMFTIRD